MRQFLIDNRRWLAWVVPSLVLMVVIGAETHWGRTLIPPAATSPVPASQPVIAAIVPEYQLPGGMEKYQETVDRPLLIPSRRQAPPPPPPTPAKSPMTRGQFALLGTTILKDKHLALLKENASGKQKRVSQGEVVNGLTVEKVEPTKVTLRKEDETETLIIQIAASPKVPPPPATPVATGVPQPGLPPGMQPVPTAINPAQVTGATPLPPPQAGLVEQRRRAARAAEQAAAQPPAAAPVEQVQPLQQQQPQHTEGAAQQNQATDWNTVFQRMAQQPRR